VEEVGKRSVFLDLLDEALDVLPVLNVLVSSTDTEIYKLLLVADCAGCTTSSPA